MKNMEKFFMNAVIVGMRAVLERLTTIPTRKLTCHNRHGEERCWGSVADASNQWG